MKVLQIVSESPIPTNCQKKYNGIAFDGCNLYITQSGACRVYCYDLSMNLLDCAETQRGYTSLAYDCSYGCFWACSNSHFNTIYKLDKCFNEIDCIHVDVCGRILGVSQSCCENCLLIAVENEMLEIDKQTGCRANSICKSYSCSYEAVATHRSFYSYSYQRHSSQFLAVSYNNDDSVIKYCLEDGYKIEDLTIMSDGYIYALATQKYCYPYLIKFKIINEDCECSNCDDFQSCQPDLPCCLPDNKCRSQCENIIESIALIETSLAHILNAEGEKIQKAIKTSNNTCELIEINECVTKTIIHITHLEQVLFSKLELVKEICPDICNRNKKNC